MNDEYCACLSPYTTRHPDPLGARTGIRRFPVFACFHGPAAVGPDVIVGLVLALIAAALVLMHSLTILVDQESLTAHLGPGAIRRSVLLADIRHVRFVRSPWYSGWGLRITTRGPLWRVSGLDAVELSLSKGRWLIGTDDPEGLMAALRLNLEHKSH